MTWVKQLKREYAASARLLRAYRDQITQPDAEPHPDLKVVEGMLAELNHNIEWMRTGREPNRRRGIDIHDAYSRRILMDMDLLPAETVERQELRATEAQKVELVRILMRLSVRERQCYLLHTAHGMSEYQIAEELKLKRASVQTHIRRAKVKVAQGL